MTDGKSDTPRTDAMEVVAYTMWRVNENWNPAGAYVPIEFARQLEREAAEWKAKFYGEAVDRPPNDATNTGRKSGEPVAWRFKPSAAAKTWAYTDIAPKYVGDGEVIEPLYSHSSPDHSSAGLYLHKIGNCFFGSGLDTPSERERWARWLDTLSAESRKFHEANPPFPEAKP